jgi:hypothetical protein
VTGKAGDRLPMSIFNQVREASIEFFLMTTEIAGNAMLDMISFDFLAGSAVSSVLRRDFFTAEKQSEFVFKDFGSCR